jgi:methionine-rich copper-binding protein CopC
MVAMVARVASVDAHARLDESSPEVGAVLDAAPAEVSITFSQDVQKITGTYGIDVFDESGAEITTEDAVLSDDDRRILTVSLPAALPTGRYVVEYRNVSDEDGDPWEGAYAFYVGRQPTPEEAAADEELLGETEEATPTAAAAAETPTPAGQATAVDSPTQAAVDGRDEDDDAGGNITLFLVVGAIALVVVLVAGGFFALSRRPNE